jgi:Tfp pilus assembly PilM family ATPase
MAHSIGIHLGERRYHLVALDGSVKKHKVVAALSGEIPSGEGAGQAVVDELREHVKTHKLQVESVHLAIASGVAAFRSLTLPFDDRDKIEEVIKFEVEGNLPQYDIDQVVVDFTILTSKPGVESNLLVTAVPKERLAAALALCERAGLEAHEAELEGTALFDAAFESGILEEDVGTVLIHVGDTSTTVAVADGRRLASLRAIRAGSRTSGLAALAAAEATELPPPGAPEVGAAEPAEVVAGASAEDEAVRLAATAQRIRREVLRTLSGARTVNEIRQVFVCGNPLPGLVGETLMDVPVEPLPFELGEVESPAEYAVAFGAALRGFDGGTLRPRLRREELRFSGRFERLELPLAVLTLLLFTLLFVQFIVLDKQLEWRDEGNLAKDPPIKGDMQIWLEESNARMLPDPRNPRAVRLPDPPKVLLDYAASAQAGLDDQRTKFEEIQRIRKLLNDEILRLSKELGQVSEIEQPQSALTAATLVMDVISSMGESARVGIRRFEAAYQTSAANREDYVMITMDADFFGESSYEATRAYNQFESLIKSKPWCMEFQGKSSKSLDGDKGIQVDGLSIQVNADRGAGGES